MADAGKLGALRKAGYRLQASCGTCAYFTPAPSQMSWGRCGAVSHVHEKHGPQATTGVRREGSCPQHVWVSGELWDLERNGYATFLPPSQQRRTDPLADDRALVERLLRVDHGLTDWEVGFVESIAAQVNGGRALSGPQRERAAQIDAGT